MRKMLRFVVGMALIASLFGCGGSGGGRQVLRVANWGGAGDESEFAATTARLIREFEEKHGVDVQVEGIPGGEYVSKLLLSYVAGTEPDIMTLDASSAAIFINSNVLLDLSPSIASERGPGAFRLADRFENIVGLARRGDRLYAIPNDFTPMVVYYNRRMFEAASVTVPQPGWTWEDFLAAAKATTRPKDGTYGFAFGNWFPGWVMWLWNGGGDVLSPDGARARGYLDGPENARTLAWLRDLIAVHRVAPSLSQAAAMGVDLFANGQAAMTVSGHWALVGYSVAPKGPEGKPRITLDDLGVVEMPRRAGPSQTVFYESGYAISRRTKRPDLAWAFIKHMTSYQARLALSKTGIAVDARKDVARERASDRLEALFLPVVPSARPPWGSRVEGFEMVERHAQAAMDSVLQRGADPMAALRRAAERIDRELKKRQP